MIFPSTPFAIPARLNGAVALVNLTNAVLFPCPSKFILLSVPVASVEYTYSRVAKSCDISNEVFGAVFPIPTRPPLNNAAILFEVFVAPSTLTSSPITLEVEEAPLPHEPLVEILKPLLVISFVPLEDVFDSKRLVDAFVNEPEVNV